MAVLVRADLTPVEFDLARRSLAAYETQKTAESKDAEPNVPGKTLAETAGVRRAAASEAVLDRELLAKLKRLGYEHPPQ